MNLAKLEDCHDVMTWKKNLDEECNYLILVLYLVVFQELKKNEVQIPGFLSVLDNW